MRTSDRARGAWVLVLALLAPASAAHAAFACPVTPPPATRPLPDLAAILRPYDDPRADPRLKAAIAGLEGAGMPNGEIVDHVIAAYCPTVNGIAGLSDRTKDALVERFASHLAQTVYAPARSDVDDVMLDVPVPPDLYTKVKEAADQRKMGQDDFVLQALRTAVGTP